MERHVCPYNDLIFRYSLPPVPIIADFTFSDSRGLYFLCSAVSTHFFFHWFSDTEFPKTIVCQDLKVFPVKVTE